MGGLLETASVIRDAAGSWASGYQFDSVACAMRSFASDVCAPITRVDMTGSAGDTEGLDANIFATLVSLPGRAMCLSGSEEAMVKEAFDAELEKSAGLALWGEIGDQAATVSMNAAATVAAGATPKATVAALLNDFWSRATGVPYSDTILHLGVGRVLELFDVVEGSILKNLDIRVATSPGYPSDAIGITGPIRFQFSPVEVLQTHDPSNNDVLTEGSVLGSLEFDPCTAVRVA